MRKYQRIFLLHNQIMCCARKRRSGVPLPLTKWVTVCTVPAASMVLALHLMNERDATLGAIDDVLTMGQDMLVEEEFDELQADMRRFVEENLIAVH